MTMSEAMSSAMRPAPKVAAPPPMKAAPKTRARALAAQANVAREEGPRPPPGPPPLAIQQWGEQGEEDEEVDWDAWDDDWEGYDDAEAWEEEEEWPQSSPS